MPPRPSILVIFPQPPENRLEAFFIVGAEGLGAAVDNVATAEANGGKAGQQDGNHPCPAVFDADDRVTVLERVAAYRQG
jgi:hypothetical protein